MSAISTSIYPLLSNMDLSIFHGRTANGRSTELPVSSMVELRCHCQTQTCLIFLCRRRRPSRIVVMVSWLIRSLSLDPVRVFVVVLSHSSRSTKSDFCCWFYSSFSFFAQPSFISTNKRDIQRNSDVTNCRDTTSSSPCYC